MQARFRTLRIEAVDHIKAVGTDADSGGGWRSPAGGKAKAWIDDDDPVVQGKRRNCRFEPEIRHGIRVGCIAVAGLQSLALAAMVRFVGRGGMILAAVFVMEMKTESESGQQEKGRCCQKDEGDESFCTGHRRHDPYNLKKAAFRSISSISPNQNRSNRKKPPVFSPVLQSRSARI